MAPTTKRESGFPTSPDASRNAYPVTESGWYLAVVEAVTISGNGIYLSVTRSGKKPLHVPIAVGEIVTLNLLPAPGTAGASYLQSSTGIPKWNNATTHVGVYVWLDNGSVAQFVSETGQSDPGLVCFLMFVNTKFAPIPVAFNTESVQGIPVPNNI